MDIMIAVHASQSLTKAGWDADVYFLNTLINEIMKSGNPQDHKISLHWFNSGSKPVGHPGGINSEGTFALSSSALVTGLQSLNYESIRSAGANHQQVLLTADLAFQSATSGSRAGKDKVLVLLTDTESHGGTGCGNLDLDEVEAAIGKCTVGGGHVCAARSCDISTCMCEVYKAHLFKRKNYKLITVGIANSNHVGNSQAGVFNQILQAVSSPGETYVANDFHELQALMLPLAQNMCSAI